MIKLEVNNDIANKNDDFMLFFEGESSVFSLDSVKKAIEDNPEEKDIKLNIHCRGGQVSEGLAIYDYLRNSGLNIFCNIEGECHSMATILLLSAPKENRTANKNCSSLIHLVRGGVCDYMTAEEFKSISEDIESDEGKILDIYADRTDLSREELKEIMSEEKTRTAEELLKWGFINKINTPNTNLKSNSIINNQSNKNQIKTEMAELKKSVLENVNAFLTKIGKKFSDNVNYEFVGEDNVILFTTEKEDDTLAVGDAASPDGTFKLVSETSEYPVDTEIVIAEGEITAITEPEEEDEVETENKALKQELKNIKVDLKEALNLITSMKAEIETNFVPQGRKKVATLKENKVVEKTKDDYKAEILALRKKVENKKKL